MRSPSVRLLRSAMIAACLLAGAVSPMRSAVAGEAPRDTGDAAPPAIVAGGPDTPPSQTPTDRPVAAPPPGRLARRISADVAVYASWPAPGKGLDAIRGSILGEALLHPAAQVYARALGRNRARLLEMLLGPPDGAQADGADAAARAAVLDLLDGPGEAALLRFPDADGAPPFVVALRPADPPDAATLADRLRALGIGRVESVADAPGRLRLVPGDGGDALDVVRTEDGTVLCTNAAASDPDAFADWTGAPTGRALADAPWFAALRRRAGTRPDAPFVCADVAQLLDRLLARIPEAGLVRRGMGMENAGCVALGGGGVADGALRHRVRLEAPKWRDGVLELMAGGGALAEEARQVSADAEWLVAFRFDPGKTWTVARNLLLDATPGLEERVIAFESALAEAAGGRLSAALPKLVGPEACLFSTRPGRAPRLFPPDAALSVRVRDPALVRATLAVLKALLGGWKWRTLEVGDETIHYFNRFSTRLPFAPSYLLTGDRLLVAAYPQVLWRWLRMRDRPRLAYAPAYREALARLDGPPAMGLVYLACEDEAALAWDGAAALLHGLTGPDGTPADAALLPPAGDVLPHRAGAAIRLYGDEDGLSIEAAGPAGAGAPAVWLAGHAVRQARSPGGVLALLLAARSDGAEKGGIPADADADPAARESVRRLLAIRAAVRSYHDDHDAWPASPQALVERGYLDPADAAAPGARGGAYLLLPVERMTAATPVAMEPLARGAAGARVVFGGGLVEWIPRADLAKVLGRAAGPDAGAPPPGNEAPPRKPDGAER